MFFFSSDFFFVVCFLFPENFTRVKIGLELFDIEWIDGYLYGALCQHSSSLWVCAVCVSAVRVCVLHVADEDEQNIEKISK